MRDAKYFSSKKVEPSTFFAPAMGFKRLPVLGRSKQKRGRVPSFFYHAIRF
jgi:hypothetical protein